MTRAQRTPQAETSSSQPRGLRLWLFRIAAATLAPILFLLTAEVGLHLVGYGQPTSFLVDATSREGVRTTNQRFGWRFFPRHLARTPVPLEIVESDETRRLFILGGSAARGTPDSAYSFGRMLEVMLEEGSGERFVVHNAAMTAINSHVVREIADDCPLREGDVLVIYLGNNEVVGPFGAGTVFGSFSSYLPLIRATIRLKATRFGQLLGNALSGADDAARHSDWRGMEHFLEQQIAADDPRLATVYEHFHANLGDIVRRAHRAGAETMLLTVATNLRDQPPFASAHRPDLSDDERSRWQELYEAGTQAAEDGDLDSALAAWRRATEIDDRYAELHFRIGHAYLARGEMKEAHHHLSLARDLDTLRFRADSRINATLERVAEEEAERGAVLVDVARRFAEGTGEEPLLPGYRRFHEHVHLNFDGNLEVATAVYEHLSELRSQTPLPSSTAEATPSRAFVADRLAYTPFDRLDLEREILRIVSRPPFTGQLAHEEDLEQRWERLAHLESELPADAWEAAERVYRQRLESSPGDLEVRRRYAALLQARRLPEPAIEHWRFLVQRLPNVGSWRASLATSLDEAGRGEEALTELEHLRQVEGETAEYFISQGTVLESLGRDDEAAIAYTRALHLHPHHSVASFNLATAALRRGELEEATRLYRELLVHHPEFARGHHNLGRCLEQQGQTDEALAAYRQALIADPSLVSAHNSLGLALEQRGDHAGAIDAYTRALAYEPSYALAHFNLADLQLGRGRADEAERHYQQGLNLRPDNVQARYNRAAALRIQGRDRAAAEELEQVLIVRPNDPGTLHNLAWILATTSPELRQPNRAVELALRAARATDSRSPEILETLATAYSAAGQRRDAIITLEKALHLARMLGHLEMARRLERRLAES